MSFPRYAEYVESGVDWLGKIPKDWQVKPLKLVSQIDTGFAFPSEVFSDAGVPVIRITDIQGRSIELKDTKRVSADFANGLTSVRPDVIKGDILMAMTGATIGKVGYYMSEECAYINQRVCRFAPHAINSSYLWHILNSTYYKEHIALEASGGAQPNISDTQLLSFKFGLSPSITEQTQIARFLDHETAKIDALIAEQKRLIKLLQEKRQAVISHAVTKGLDPNVPMKDSGVEWLGAIPKHWHSAKVWMYFELGRGRVISNEEIQDFSGEYPVYSSQTKDNGVMGKLNTFDFEGDYITWTTDGANAGTVSRRSGKFNCTNVCGTMKPLQRTMWLDFYAYALSRATSWFVRHDINPKLMNNVVSSIPIPILPFKEQTQIARFLDHETAKLDELGNQALNSIELMKERRSALISAAVTGKIDVRDWQPPADESAFDEDVQKAGMEASA